MYFILSWHIIISLSGVDKKYKSEEEIRSDYPQILQEFTSGEFPPSIIDELKELVQNFDKTPLIVRSSSLLEDNFGMSFAGKYDSFFPSQSRHIRRKSL